MRYPFEQLFLVCTGERCNSDKHGKDAGLEIRSELKDLNTKLGRKSTVRICSVSCLDLCDHGPNMIAEPSGTIYAHLTRDKALAAYRGEMGDAPRREDLSLDESEFRKGGSAAAKKK
jgi:hypothetical protein